MKLNAGDVISIRHFRRMPNGTVVWRVDDFKFKKMFPPGHFVDVEPRPEITPFNGFHVSAIVKRKVRAM